MLYRAGWGQRWGARGDSHSTPIQCDMLLPKINMREGKIIGEGRAMLKEVMDKMKHPKEILEKM